MNYLAHIYLSGEDEKVLVGNFIGDYIKGKNYSRFPEQIQKGITLHRNIDTFTDQHPKFKEAKKLFHQEYGLYSGIIIDLLYDHLLARNWEFYCANDLRTFTKRTHAILLSNYFYLPKRVQGFLPFLIQNRRLESYATTQGIQQSMKIMSKYTSLPENSVKAIEIFKENLGFLEKNFSYFMNDLMLFVEDKFIIEIKKPDLITGL